MIRPAQVRRGLRRPLALAAVYGPGLLVMLADADAGNVISAAQAGMVQGYRLLPLLLALIPMLYLVQELAARLGVYTGRGFCALVRERMGAGWAWAAVAGLVVAVAGTLVTDLTGIAGVGELYGVSRLVSLPVAAAGLLAVMLTGTYRRVERVAIAVGLLEVAFLAVAWAAHPSIADLGRDLRDVPVRDAGFLYLVAALIGATFNPWMVFYQQAATAQKKLGPEAQGAVRLDTATGAVLTQVITAAVLVAVAATIGARGGTRVPLDSIGQISRALAPVLGDAIGRLVFGVGVTGAAVVAAIVCSLSLAWGLGEAAGRGGTAGQDASWPSWFGALYALCVCASALTVWLAPDLVRLTTLAQVVNAVLLPFVVGLLIRLAAMELPTGRRLRGPHLAVVIAICAAVSLVGLLSTVGSLV